MEVRNKGFVEPADIEGNGAFRLDPWEHIIAQPLAVLGMRNAGKSYFVGKVLEGLCEYEYEGEGEREGKGVARLPFLIIDREGEYWTLRERYPVIVASVGKPSWRPKGYSTNLSLMPSKAGSLAMRCAERGYSLILDLRDASLQETYETLALFLEGLFEAEGRFSRPVVLVMEEAHNLVPEVGRVRLKELRRLQDRVVYWTYEIVSSGRHRGIGFILVARRAAEVAKAVLSQCPIRVVFRMVDPSDFEWLRASGLKPEQVEALKGLPQGRAVVLGLGDPFFIKVRQRACSHGGSTPLGGKPMRMPELEGALGDLKGFLEAASATRDLSAMKVKERAERMLKEADRVLKRARDLASWAWNSVHGE